MASGQNSSKKHPHTLQYPLPYLSAQIGQSSERQFSRYWCHKKRTKWNQDTDKISLSKLASHV